MQDTETTCEEKATVKINEFQEADVVCGRGVHDGKTHVATQSVSTTDGKKAFIKFVWHA
jgi:hypothetical protein